MARIPQAMVSPEMVGSEYGPTAQPTGLPDLPMPGMGPSDEDKMRALLEAMAAMGALPEEQALLMNQMGQGAGMMNTPGAQGQNVGGTYVASSPLEHLGVLAQRGVGAYKQGQAEQGYRDTLAKQTAGRQAFGEQQMGQQDEEMAMMKALLAAMQGGGNPGPSGWGNGY